MERLARRPITAGCLSAAIVSVLVVTLVASPAHAASSGLTVDQAKELTTRMLDVGVHPSKVPELIRAVESGDQLDSETPGATPISTADRVEDGYQITTSEYEDGSVSEYGIEVGAPAGAPTPSGSGISSCRYGSNAGVKYGQNCHVFYHGINWSSSFNADWSSWSGGASATYRSATAKTVSWLGVNNEKVSKIESGTRLRYSLNLSAAGWGNTPFWLDMKVNSSGAHVLVS